MMNKAIKLFVPLGTQKFPFNRLVKALNGLVESGVYSPQEIVMQSTIYEERPLFTHHEIIPLETFNSYLDKAEVIITHSGVNSIISSMNRRKPLIIVPRMKKFGEHVDDHQIQLVEAFSKMGIIEACLEVNDINDALVQVRSKEFNAFHSNTNVLLKSIDEYITQNVDLQSSRKNI